MATLLMLAACSTSGSAALRGGGNSGDVRAGNPGSGDTPVAGGGGAPPADTGDGARATANGQGFSEGGPGGESLLDGPEQEDIIVPFLDPRTGVVYDVADGCIMVAFQNPPQLMSVNYSHFDQELPSSDPYVLSQTYGWPSLDPAVAAFIAAEQLTVYSEWPVAKSIAAYLPPGQSVLDAVVNWPLQYPTLIRAVDPDAIAYFDDDPYPLGPPNDVLHGDEWHQKDATPEMEPDQFPPAQPTEFDINIRSVWRKNDGRSFGSSGTVIAILDTGVQFEHSDLFANSTYWGVNVGDDWGATTVYPRAIGGGVPWQQMQDINPEGCGHGTCVAGVISAGINNDDAYDIDGDKDISGIAQNCKYLPVAMKSKWGEIKQSRIANGLTVILAMKNRIAAQRNLKGIPYVPYYNIEVLNCSFGEQAKNETVEFLLNLLSLTTLSVCSAGNDFTAQANYPAAYGSCMSVRGYDESGNMLFNRHPSVDIAGPAIGIWTTDMVGKNSLQVDLGWSELGNVEKNGTSFAAPAVAAVAALVTSNVSMPVSTLKATLETSAVQIGSYVFDRRVDALNALYNPIP